MKLFISTPVHVDESQPIEGLSQTVGGELRLDMRDDVELIWL